MDKSISENVRELATQIEAAKEEWLFRCMNTLHYGLPFDKKQLKEYFAELIKENSYKVFSLPNDSGFNNIYLAYSYDFTEGVELKYIAEFTITKEELTQTGLCTKEKIVNHKEINSTFKIEYSLPLVTNDGNILKTTLRF